jgi:hypothetical protein
VGPQKGRASRRRARPLGLLTLVLGATAWYPGPGPLQRGWGGLPVRALVLALA